MAGSVVMGGSVGYEISSRLFEGRTPLGKTAELAIKAGSTVMGSVVGLVVATYGLLTKQEVGGLIDRTR